MYGTSPVSVDPRAVAARMGCLRPAYSLRDLACVCGPTAVAVRMACLRPAYGACAVPMQRLRRACAVSVAWLRSARAVPADSLVRDCARFVAWLFRDYSMTMS